MSIQQTQRVAQPQRRPARGKEISSDSLPRKSISLWAQATGSLQNRKWNRWLFAAGLYNLVWGLFTILFPNVMFDLFGAERPNYPEIWQCVGMIVGVYGIGYVIAASDAKTHWPIVLVGLLGKIFGPIGFVSAWLKGTFPLAFGLTILTNDLIWWLPFALILRNAFRIEAEET